MAHTYLPLTLSLCLSACSNDYTPPINATGQHIFQHACAECHKAENKETPGMFFSLPPIKANPAYLADNIRAGSLLMPNFPNIDDTAMRALTEYILIHTLIE